MHNITTYGPGCQGPSGTGRDVRIEWDIDIESPTLVLATCNCHPIKKRCFVRDTGTVVVVFNPLDSLTGFTRLQPCVRSLAQGKVALAITDVMSAGTNGDALIYLSVQGHCAWAGTHSRCKQWQKNGRLHCWGMVGIF